jgi:asparagine synthetase B (glutamine-hydrolysing)
MLVFQKWCCKDSKILGFVLLDKVDASDEEYFSILKERLVRSVESHLVSDVPVGSLLSGGWIQV